MEFILDGLCCGNCALKIEKGVNDLSNVKSASLDFVTQTLRVELNNPSDSSNIHSSIEQIVKNIEPDVSVREKVVNKKNLEKIEVSASEHDSHEHGEHDEHEGHTHEHGVELNKKKIILIGCSLILSIVGVVGNFAEPIEFFIFFAAYLIVGYDIIFRAFKNIIRGQVFDENFLMTIATFGALFIGEFLEATAVMLFYKVGEYFQDMAVQRSRKSITSLMDIRPDYANLQVGDDTKKVSPEDVSVGDIILVKAGERVPLDGIVIEGKSLLDVSALTGESLPREIKTGDEALSGSINKNGLLLIKVTKTFGDSTVSKILDLVQNVSGRKAKTENFITKFARYYTPAVVGAAVVIAVLPSLIIKDALFSDWLYKALVFLVISCPCALVVSIPLTFFSGVGAASRKGILVKGTNYLEALNDVTTVVFDKTGTLTEGKFKVTDIESVDGNGLTKEQLLECAAHIESFSNHPIAVSIVKEYGAEIDKHSIKKYFEIEGQGIKALYNGKEVFAGNTKLMESNRIEGYNKNLVNTAVHIAIEKKYAGYIVVEDKIKKDAKEAIAELKSMGISKTVMLTGDNLQIANNVSNKLGIDVVYAELLPHEKVEKVESLIEEAIAKKGKVLFVGDGINDAPVLTRADVGVAMGGVGSDAAIEAADIVIMTDEPSKIATAIKVARRTRSIVWQNITLAIVIKLAAMLLSVFGVATIWEAVIADVGVTLIAVLNSMRAQR